MEPIIKEEDYIMLSALQHYYFCQRQCALIHIEQLWEENYHTQVGNIMHENVHKDKTEKRKSLLQVTGLRIVSSSLGIVGTTDMVEFHKSESSSAIRLPKYNELWEVTPIEYKKGKEKKNSCDRVQLCSQAICLEEMLNTSIDNGFLFYGEKKRRVEVIFDSYLRHETLKTISSIHELFRSGITPKGNYSKKCLSCSLIEKCMPKSAGKQKSVNNYFKKYIEE